MISKKALALCATVGVALSGFAVAAPAQADPVSNSYAIVGSDTLEDVVSALTNGTNITGSFVRTTTDHGATVGSFDATGSPYITTKPSGVRFARPNGSGDGVLALSRAINGGVYSSTATGATGPTNVVVSGQVDIARSSGPTKVQNTSGSLAYVPFGRDALSYVYQGNAALANLDKATLLSLYTCSVRVIGGVTVTPIIPQNGSGTRSSFLSMIGTDEAGLKTTSESGCVVESQEHDATKLTADSIMPMSVSRWVSMNTGASYDKRGAGILSTPLAAFPVTGTGTSMIPNPAYYADATFGRNTYLVVEYARVSAGAKLDADLRALLDPTLDQSLSNSDVSVAGTAGSVKKKFGFLPPVDDVIVRATIS